MSLTEGPYRKAPLQILFNEDLSDVTHYLSRQRLVGMDPTEDLGLRLFAQHLRPREETELQFEDQVGDVHRVRIGSGTGGCVQEWWPPHPQPQLSNNAGMAGRSILNQAVFVSRQSPYFHANPTMAGDKYDAFFPDLPSDPKIPDPPINYDRATLIHGSRLLSLEVGKNYFRTLGIPIEWDPDGTWDGMKFNHGGNSQVAIEYPDLRLGFEVDVNWERPGLHRVTSLFQTPMIDPSYTLKWSPLSSFPRFGFDDILHFNGDLWQARSVVDEPLCEQLEANVLVWEDKGNYWLGRLDRPHGRQAETRQSVFFLMPDSKIEKVSCIFMDGEESNRMRIHPKHTTRQPSIPQPIIAAAAYLAQLSDVQARYGFQDRLAIGGGTGKFDHSDQTGSYPFEGLQSESGGGLIYAAKADSSNPWSFGMDFAYGVFSRNLTKRAGPAGEVGMLRYASKTGGGVPKNGQKDSAVMVASNTLQWDAGKPKPSGLVRATNYVMTGTLQQVIESMSFLALSDLETF